MAWKQVSLSPAGVRSASAGASAVTLPGHLTELWVVTRLTASSGPTTLEILLESRFDDTNWAENPCKWRLESQFDGTETATDLGEALCGNFGAVATGTQMAYYDNLLSRTVRCHYYIAGTNYNFSVLGYFQEAVLD